MLSLSKGTESNSNYGSVERSNRDSSNNSPADGGETMPLLNEPVHSFDPSAGSSHTASITSSTINSTPTWLSNLTFQWFVPMMDLGNQKEQLQPDDLNLISFPINCTTNHIADKFNYYWQQQLELSNYHNDNHNHNKQNQSTSKSNDKFTANSTKSKTNTNSKYTRNPSLIIALFQGFGFEFIKAGMLKFIHDSSLFVGPQVLNGLIHFLRDPKAPLSHGLFLTLLVTASQLIMTFCLRHYFFKCYLTGLQIRSAVVLAVYHKALRLNSSERQSRSLGEITNLISIDAQRMQELTSYLHAIWYSFLQIGLALYFLWGQMGIASLGGVCIMIFMMPVTKIIAQWLAGIQKKLMAAKDARVQLNSELLSSMKVIKLQAWEEPFQTRLMKLRNVEVDQLWRYFVAQTLSIMMWSITPLAVALATFTSYIMIGKQLEVASALTALALFDILRFPLFMLPQIINRIVEASISVNRIQSFLLCDDHTPIPTGSLHHAGIQMHNASFVYDSRRPKMDAPVDLHSSNNSNSVRTTKELLDKDWEIQLLKSQLRDAEQQLETLVAAAAGTGTSQSRTTIPTGTATEPETNHSNSTNYIGNEETTTAAYDAPDLLCLKRINFTCRRGELVAVVGSVGSGKSSLVQAILGEIRQVGSGVCYNNSNINSSSADNNINMNCNYNTMVKGKLSYFSQSAFILNDTVRNNILFGHTDDPHVNEELYQECISSCALAHDLKLLPAGDETEIGEKGITLSGGQKARVALARTMYHDADIAILDDPLAAVDAHVGKHLFQKCILEQLLLGGSQTTDTKGAEDGTNHSTQQKRKKSVVLITNALQYLNHPMVDRIVVFQNGRVVEQGTYKELATNPDSLFQKYLTVMAETGVSPTAAAAAAVRDIQAGADADGSDTPGMPISTFETDSSADSENIQKDNAVVDTNKEFSSPTSTTNNGNLMTSEFKERVVGKVDTQVYFAWGKAAGGLFLPVLIVGVYGLVESINVLSKWWLTYWSAHGADASQMYFLGIYAMLNVATVAAVSLRLLLMMSCGIRASRKMFVRLLGVVLYAPMSFFDTTPIGRIINRFSGDMNTVDVTLIETLRSYLMTLFSICSTIIVISIITPIFALCLVPIVAFYMMQQAYFTATYRELKRLDSIGRSPIYALLGETLDGVASIRAFSAQNTFKERLHKMLDRQQHAYYLISAAQCWLGIRLEMVGTMIVTFACLSSVLHHLAKGGDETFAGLAGLAISYALSVTQSLNWSVRMASDFEANMVAVERIEQYCSIPSEAARVTPMDSTVPPNWPEHGEIIFAGAKLRYRPDLPLVLRGLDIRIPAGSKVGVVGRTGAGKSTLMVAMLRIVELCEGRILIDGVDHSQLGLAKLRSKIAVIPQDPVLFSGTIRTNLDPFEEYSDERLLDVLNRVGLYSTTSTTSTTNNSFGSKESAVLSSTSLSSMSGQVISLLDTVADGGSNFSVGQRQLIVIARALLCESKVVIMDEATAAVDADTDARIQRVMRIDFAHATCLTVAHRINTILDSNYIMVMSDGQAAEFDTPQNLMERTKGGLFRDLVEATASSE